MTNPTEVVIRIVVTNELLMKKALGQKTGFQTSIFKRDPTAD
jgi:hypothetical protein